MKKSLMMKNKLEKMKVDAQNLLNENKIKDAQDKMQEVKDMKAAIVVQEELEEEEEAVLAADAQAKRIGEEFGNKDLGLSKNKTKENANFLRAAIKTMTNKPLSEAENALLLPTTAEANGVSGEGYILPQDIRTLIEKKIRQYKSIRDVIGYMPAGALTGSFPIEDFETVTGLVDFTDGEDGTDDKEIKFKNVSYKLKEKAAFIKLSNTLIALTDNALVAYIVEIFAKKAVVTENKLGMEIIKLNKTKKVLKGWKDLKKSINKDLDPGVLFGSVIVTNQDGWDYLDSEVDTNGRPILQPDPSNPTKYLFKGLTVEVYSNTMLATVGNKAPVIYGNLEEAIKFVDLSGLIQFATSEAAGFMSNTTVARVIEFIDVVQKDKSDKCYIVGEIDVTPPVA
ncbi:MAG: phage major capsid protein [Clostridium sp.]